MEAEIIYALKTAVISRYTFRLRAESRISLPGFSGKTFRGGFGKALLKIACPERKCRQSDCANLFTCPYSYIFETPVPPEAEALSLHTNVTHPFIIESPFGQNGLFEKDDIIELNLILIGNAIDYLPYCILAFEALGVMGIGKDRGKYYIEEVVSANENGNALIYSGTERKYAGDGKKLSFADIMDSSRHVNRECQNRDDINIKFMTPGRFEHGGRLVTERLEFHILLRSILRRVSTLAYFHCGRLKLDMDFKGLIDKAKNVKIAEEKCKWVDYERRSTRKRKWMKLGGLLGNVKYQGRLDDFIPYLLLAEYIHVGKSVSFGLGQIVLGVTN